MFYARKPFSVRQKVGQIKSIWLYPVKSMVGSQITEAQLTKNGLTGDRQWVLWDELEHQLLGGKQFRKIMQLAAVFSQANDFNTNFEK